MVGIEYFTNDNTILRILDLKINFVHVNLL